MAPIRLLHLADIHIGMENYGRLDPATGLNSRVVDFLRRFDEAIDYALENEVDLVIFSGDAYKTRNPNSTYQREFAKRIKSLSDAGIPTVLLVGNHDLPSAESQAESIDIFKTLEVPNVIVARAEKLHRIETKHGPVQVVAIPYPLRSRLLAHEEFRGKTIREIDQAVEYMITKNIQTLAEHLDQKIPAILTAHLTVSEAEQGSETRVMLGRDVVILKSVLANPAFDYVALGHIHKHQDVNPGYHPPVVYSGSLERIDFGEEKEDKGFVVAEIERGQTSYKFIKVKARPFLTIRAEAKEPDPMEKILAQIARRKAEVKDAVVRVQIQTTPESEPLIDEKRIRAALKEAYFIASINKKVESESRQRLDIPPEELTPRQALERYFKNKGLSQERIKVLLEYADEIFRKVDMI